jgi:hypothetical protein
VVYTRKRLVVYVLGKHLGLPYLGQVPARKRFKGHVGYGLLEGRRWWTRRGADQMSMQFKYVPHYIVATSQYVR